MRIIVTFCVGLALTVGGLKAFATDCDVNEPLEHRLMRHEGVVACAYRDHLGNYTIGIGHLLMSHAEHADMCWEPEKVHDVFLMDIERARQNARYDVSGRVWDGLTQNRQDVLTELSFQLGGYGLGLFKRMLAAIQLGDFHLAAKELRSSRLEMQTPNRTNELACLLEMGG